MGRNRERRLRSPVSRVDISPLDVAENNAGRLLNLLDDRRVALGRIARSRVSAVEPGHEAALIPPDTHREHHTPAHGAAHLLHATDALEVGSAVGRAVRVVHGDSRGDVLDDGAVLDVFADYGLEGALGGGELRYDSERLGGVDLATGLVVVLVCAVGVLAAAVLVAGASKGALVTSASEDGGIGAGVRSDLGCGLVGLPKVELVAADALAFNVTLCLLDRVTSIA